MTVDIIDRLRSDASPSDIADAANMLEFFFDQIKMHSPRMNGEHGYRFRPVNLVGLTAEEAVRRCIDKQD